MSDTRPRWGGWDPGVRDDPFPRFAEARGLAWTHGDGPVLRGLAALPVLLGPDRRPR